jgi:hypothetical protein
MHDHLDSRAFTIQKKKDSRAFKFGLPQNLLPFTFSKAQYKILLISNHVRFRN